MPKWGYLFEADTSLRTAVRTLNANKGDIDAWVAAYNAAYRQGKILRFKFLRMTGSTGHHYVVNVHPPSSISYAIHAHFLALNTRAFSTSLRFTGWAKFDLEAVDIPDGLVNLLRQQRNT